MKIYLWIDLGPLRSEYLIIAQQRNPVDWCTKIDKKYNNNDVSKAIYNIYSGEESQIYAYEPETVDFQEKPNLRKITCVLLVLIGMWLQVR